jgi:hypothetical protein
MTTLTTKNITVVNFITDSWCWAGTESTHAKITFDNGVQIQLGWDNPNNGDGYYTYKVIYNPNNVNVQIDKNNLINHLGL